jgi:hypothetical protein
VKNQKKIFFYFLFFKKKERGKGEGESMKKVIVTKMSPKTIFS